MKVFTIKSDYEVINEKVIEDVFDVLNYDMGGSWIVSDIQSDLTLIRNNSSNDVYVVYKIISDEQNIFKVVDLTFYLSFSTNMQLL